MSWLKKTKNEVVLYHSSPSPYIINDNGVWICDGNLFPEKETDIDNHMCFSINNNKVKRQSTYFWNCIEFPVKISASKIHNIHNKPSNDIVEEKIRAAIYKEYYIRTVSNDELEDVGNTYDKSFLVTKTASLSEKCNKISDQITSHIVYDGLWQVALVNILDNVCLTDKRNKNWHKKIPDISLDIYGIREIAELDNIKDVIVQWGISEKFDISVK